MTVSAQKRGEVKVWASDPNYQQGSTSTVQPEFSHLPFSRSGWKKNGFFSGLLCTFVCDALNEDVRDKSPST